MTYLILSDIHANLEALEAVRALLRASVPTLVEDRHFSPDMEKATALVVSGVLVPTLGGATAPAIVT